MAQEQRIENRNDNKERKDPQTERKPIWTITGTAIAIQVFLISLFFLWVFIPDYVQDRSDAAQVFIESMFSLAIVIVVVVHAMMYYKQARAMDAQVQQTERAIKAAEDNVETVEKTSIYANRAYVTAKIRSVTSVTKRLDTFLMRLRIENSGNTPANNLVVVYGCGLKEKPPWEKTPEGLLICDSPSPYVTRLGVVAPNDSYQVVDTPRISFESIEDFRAFEDGKLAFYCWGNIVYEDIFNEKRHTAFSFVQSAAYPNGYPCEYGNEVF